MMLPLQPTLECACLALEGHTLLNVCRQKREESSKHGYATKYEYFLSVFSE
jgi:hypothetical protein